MTPDGHRPPLAADFFLAWLCVLYLGADHPPPRGFVLLLGLASVASVLVYLRTPTYADWHTVRRPYRVLRVLREGAVAGLTFGMLTLVYSAARPGSTVVLDWEPVLIWLVGLTIVGAMNGGLLYVVVSLRGGSARRTFRPRGRPPLSS